MFSDGNASTSNLLQLESSLAADSATSRTQSIPDPAHLRIRAHIRQLESRIVLKAHSKIWLTFLNLALDPVIDVAQLAIIVVEHVQKISAVICAKIRERDEKIRNIDTPNTPRLRAIEVAASPSNRPTFMIGSPSTSSDQPSTTIQTPKPNRSVSEDNTTPSIAIAINGGAGPVLELGTNLPFQPKRSIFLKGPNDHPSSSLSSSTQDSTVNESTVAVKRGLISSDVVGWCSKRFTEPLLDILQTYNGDDRIDDQVF